MSAWASVNIVVLDHIVGMHLSTSSHSFLLQVGSRLTIGIDTSGHMKMEEKRRAEEALLKEDTGR